MKARVFRHINLLLLVLLPCAVFSQGHLFSEVKVDRGQVYVGQPVEVRVGVYTSTWFTSGINPGNIKVQGAFTTFFRSVSQSRNINGKTYAGVEMIFNVFPFDDEDILFPALEIEVETPDEGDYKAKKRTVNTEARQIKVKPVPKGYEKDTWLVASGMTVNDNWSGSLENIKVGDVLERKITRNVSGTVPELIPPIIWDTLQGVRLYPSRPEVNSDKTNANISASRVEGMRYLFEQEGTITIPEIVLTWWDPARNKLYKRTLKAYTLEILPNPDLGMLESLRDSLAVSLTESYGVSEQEAKGFLGLTKRQWASIILGFAILVYLLIKIYKWLFITRKVVTLYKERRHAYHQSERYYFKQFKRSLKKQSNTLIIQSVYKWIDIIHLKEPSIHYFAETYGGIELVNEAHQMGSVFDHDIELHKIIRLKNWSAARKNYLAGIESNYKSESVNWINP